MRATIFGASGLFGKALMREWTGDTVIGLSSRDADIRDPERVQKAVQELNVPPEISSLWPGRLSGPAYHHSKN